MTASSKYTIALISLVGILLAGCAESSRPVSTGKGTIRALNASVTAPDIRFLLEEREIAIAVFKDSTTAASFDNLDYIANFDYRFLGDLTATRLTSTPFTLTADSDHLFVFTGSLTAPRTLLWERPNRTWDSAETVFEVEFAHLSPQLGAVDFYFATPGTMPIMGEAKASLSKRNRSALVELPEDDYELIVTTKDDPADVLFTSTVLAFAPAARYMVSLFDNDRSTVSPVEVRIIQQNGLSLTWSDAGSPPSLRLFNASYGLLPAPGVDLYRDMDFSTPVISGATFGVVTPYVATPPETSTFTFTEANNVGNILLESEFAVANGRLTTRFVHGSPPNLLSTPFIDDLRNVDNRVKLRLVQMSVEQTAVDLYLVENGIDIADVPPRFFNVPTSISPGYIEIDEGSYQIYATIPGEKTILAGPFDFDAAYGDVIHFALIDTADPVVLEWVKYDQVGFPVP